MVESEPGQLDSGVVTLADVARVASVDLSTVSRVLTGDPKARVSAATRDRIRDAADRLGYVVNANARSLVRRKTMTIGLLIPSIGGFVYADVVRGASDSAREKGYVLVVADTSGGGTAEDAFHALVSEGRVDGLLIASGRLTDSLESGTMSPSRKCVVLNRQIKGGYASIIEDDEQGMALGVSELLVAGHTRIACLAGPENVDTSRRRVQGYTTSIRAAGLPVDDRYIVGAGFSEQDGFDGMTQILALSPRPTAVAIASVAAAIGALSACRANGVTVPDDMSMVAFHDAELAGFLSPPLTTVAMPLYELGRIAMDLLDDQLQGRHVPILTRVSSPDPELRRRQSVAPPRVV